jgi:SPP1 family predicted phage head-tail adaptor
MKAGRLKHWVTFEEFATEIDSDGITTETWTAVTPRIPADIVDLYGRELVAAQAIASKVSSTITIRYRTGIDAKWRIRHRDTLYGIEAVIADGDTRTKSLKFLVSSGVAEG